MTVYFMSISRWYENQCAAETPLNKQIFSFPLWILGAVSESGHGSHVAKTPCCNGGEYMSDLLSTTVTSHLGPAHVVHCLSLLYLILHCHNHQPPDLVVSQSVTPVPDTPLSQPSTTWPCCFTVCHSCTWYSTVTTINHLTLLFYNYSLSLMYIILYCHTTNYLQLLFHCLSLMYLIIYCHNHQSPDLVVLQLQSVTHVYNTLLSHHQLPTVAVSLSVTHVPNNLLSQPSTTWFCCLTKTVSGVSGSLLLLQNNVTERDIQWWCWWLPTEHSPMLFDSLTLVSSMLFSH